MILDMVTRMPLYVACSVSLAAGLIQLLLAWWGHLLWDTTWTRSADQVEVPLFGYFATFNWWVPYVTVVPLMVGSSVHGLTMMRRLCGGSKLCRRGQVLAITGSVALSGVFVGREIVRSLTLEPTEWHNGTICARNLWVQLGCGSSDWPFTFLGTLTTSSHTPSLWRALQVPYWCQQRCAFLP